jgi:hypothetical protein
MSRNVVFVQPPPRAGFIIWSFVALYYVGVVLPLMAVWYFIKFTVIGILWIATQIGVFLAQRKAAAGEPPPPVEKKPRRRRPHPLERLVLGKELAEAFAEKQRAERESVNA